MPSVTFQNHFRHSFHCCTSTNSITKTDIAILINFDHSISDTVFYKHAKFQTKTDNNVFITKFLQGTFYFYLDNFANNIGMEIILASMESSLNCLPDDTMISKLSFPT